MKELIFRPRPFRRIILWAGLLVLLHLSSCSVPGLLDKIPAQVPGLADLLGESNGITTNIRNALTSMPSMDDYSPKAYAPMPVLGRGPNNGFLISRPGAYEFNARSYCLHAGTYGPTKGDGYVYAPLSGPRASMIQKIAQNTVSHREIPQQDVQVLIWTILERGNLLTASAGVKKAASTLLSDKDIQSINKSAITKFVSEEVLDRALAKMPEEVRPMVEARARLRSMLGRGDSTYRDLERAAVLTGTHPMGKGSLQVQAGRWSYHPDGYFVRYFPSGYSQTLIQLQIPSAFSVKRDNQNRITSVFNGLGQGLEIEYDEASPPATIDGESLVKASSFKAVRLVQFTPIGPEIGRLKETALPLKGWTIVGACSGKARLKNAPDAYPGLKQRYGDAMSLAQEAERVVEGSRKYGRGPGGGSLSTLSKSDMADLGHLAAALKTALMEGAKNPSDSTKDAVLLVQVAWQRALCEQAGAMLDFRGGSLSSPRAFAPAGADFWEPSPAAPDSGSPQLPEFDPSSGAATPGNTSCQRLLPSATPAEEPPYTTTSEPEPTPPKKDKDCDAVRSSMKELETVLKAFQDTPPLPGESGFEYAERVQKKFGWGDPGGAVAPMETTTNCTIEVNEAFYQNRPAVVREADYAHETVHQNKCRWARDSYTGGYGSWMDDAQNYRQNEIDAYQEGIRVLKDWLSKHDCR